MESLSPCRPISGHARTRHPAQGVGSYPMILRRPLPGAAFACLFLEQKFKVRCGPTSGYSRRSRWQVQRCDARCGNRQNQAEEKTLPAESHAQLDNGPAAVPAAPAPAESLSAVAPPQANQWSAASGAAIPCGSQGSDGESGGTRGEAAKTRRGKTSWQSWPASSDCEQGQGEICKPTHRQAGTDRRFQGRNPMTQPSQATNGTFGFVQSVVNSLTSTTAKLFEWGRN